MSKKTKWILFLALAIFVVEITVSIWYITSAHFARRWLNVKYLGIRTLALNRLIELNDKKSIPEIRKLLNDENNDTYYETVEKPSFVSLRAPFIGAWQSRLCYEIASAIASQ